MPRPKQWRARPLTPEYPGYAGPVESPADFAKCSIERRMAILASFSALIQRITNNLERAEARLDEASLAVAREQEMIDSEREFLANIMATYIGFTQVLAVGAAQAIEARSGETGTGSTEGESAVVEDHAPETQP